jgi:hypothetical protein
METEMATVLVKALAQASVTVSERGSALLAVSVKTSALALIME